jgi:hypothetical protein
MPKGQVESPRGRAASFQNHRDRFHRAGMNIVTNGSTVLDCFMAKQARMVQVNINHTPCIFVRKMSGFYCKM